MDGNPRGPIVWETCRWERLITTVTLMQYKVLRVRTERVLCKGRAMGDGGKRKQGEGGEAARAGSACGEG